MIWMVSLGCIGLLLLTGGAVLGLYAQRNWRTASQLGRPLSRIGKLRPGFRKVRGKVAAIGKPLRSPVTDMECVYYRLHVEEERRRFTITVPSEPLVGRSILAEAREAWNTENSRSVYSWRTLLDETYDVPLVIEDDTGCVEVDLRGAAVFTKERKQIVSGDNYPPPSRLEELLREKHGIHSVDDRGFFRTLRFVEEVLLIGVKVTIAGPVEQLESGDLCFRASSDGDALVVSEGDVAKQRQSAHSRAIGFAAGAGAAVAVGLCCLFGAIVFIIKLSD